MSSVSNNGVLYSPMPVDAIRVYVVEFLQELAEVLTYEVGTRRRSRDTDSSSDSVTRPSGSSPWRFAAEDFGVVETTRSI